MSDYHVLGALAAQLDEYEAARIAAENRVRSLAARDDVPMVHLTVLADAMEATKRSEHALTLALQRAMREHPLGPFVKATKGLGMKQAARLLAASGDPADRPNVAKFWQYCGHGDPERSRLRRGQPVEFSPTAKMRAHLVAESCIKQMTSPYRATYDAARASWVDRDTTDMHKHNHALRLVAKAVLRDMWREARVQAGLSTKALVPQSVAA